MHEEAPKRPISFKLAEDTCGVPMEWMPRDGRAAVADCVWLGRYIDKARRHDLLGAKSGDLLGEYMFGKNDYLDAQLLRFLAIPPARVAGLIRAEPDDEQAARSVLRASRRTPAECVVFNRAFLRRNAPFLAMLDADEGRARNGVYAKALKAFYAFVIVPPATLIYRLAGRVSR